MDTGKTSNPTYQDYLSIGFIPVLCKGYHPEYNQSKDYERAKEPARKGWNSPEYVPPTLEGIGTWEKAGVWTGWKPPREKIILDVDKGPDDIARVREICQVKGIEPGVHRTNNGLHFFFHTDRGLKGDSEVYAKCGVNVTYRVSNNQVILAPINGRSWELWKEPKDLPSLPDELIPYDRKNLQDVLNCLSWHVSKAYRAGHFSGYEDLDAAFMALLIGCKLSREQTHHAFEITFGQDYDERQTDTMYERTHARIESGEPVLGAGSFIQRVKDRGLDEVYRFARELQAVASAKEKIQGTSGHRKPPVLRVVSVAEILTIEFKPREAILLPWLHTQGLTMIHSPRGVGKTHVGIWTAVAVTSGGSFLRWRASKPFGVLYLDGEMPGAVLQERFALAIRSSRTEPIAPLKIITPDLQETGMPDLSTEEGQEAVEPHLADVSLVIVDNLSTLCRSGRENEGESWLPMQGWTLRLRSRGYSVISIHHDGKGGQQRGTSRKEDVLDTVIHLKRPGDYRPEEGARFEVHFEKARGIYGDDVKPFETMLVTNPDGIQEWTMKDLEESLTQRIASLLNEGIPQHEIADMIGVAKGTVSKHKNKAQALGLLGGKK